MRDLTRGPDPFADAKQCSEAALATYALSSAESAEKIAEMAFRKCADKWRQAFDPVGQEMDGKPPRRDALRRGGLMVENCTYGQSYDQCVEST